jgi:hypothetical protein
MGRPRIRCWRIDASDAEPGARVQRRRRDGWNQECGTRRRERVEPLVGHGRQPADDRRSEGHGRVPAFEHWRVEELRIERPARERFAIAQ